MRGTASILTVALLFALCGTTLQGQFGAPAIELISVTLGGRAGGGAVYESFPGIRPQVSADHRYVVFASTSSELVAGDTNGQQDIFLRDRRTGSTTLVSLGFDGSPANGDSTTPTISANGRYVAFASDATNLVPGGTNGFTHIFVRDLQDGTTVLASRASGGTLANHLALDPAISADGRYVAFSSAADNLVPGDTNRFNSDIFMRDLLTETTERVSLRPDGSQIVAASSNRPSISADGRRIAFDVTDDPLGGPAPPGPPNLHHGVYVRDLDTATTILVSALPDGTPAERRYSLDPEISADGRHVVFHSRDDLDPDAPDAHLEVDGPFPDVFVRDLQTSITERISLPFSGGPAEESGALGTISRDGRYVAYASRDNGIRVRDRLTGTTTNVTAPGGVPFDAGIFLPSISEDGALVYFESWATNLVPNDSNDVLDVFLYVAAPTADLSLSLGVSHLEPSPNSDVTFTVTVVNDGPSNAAAVAVGVPLPAGLTYLSSAGRGDYDESSGTWTVGDLAAGSSANLQIVARFTAATTVSVTAQVIDSSLFDPDSTPGDDDPGEDDQQTVLLTSSLADLSLALSANTVGPAVNSNVTLTLMLTNGGPASASGVTVRVPLPAGLTFVSASPAAYDAATGIWTLAAIPAGVTVPPGATLGLQLVARVTSAAAADVTAQVSASNRPDPDSTPNNGNPAEDDQQSVRLTPMVTGIVVNHHGAQINPNDGLCTLREAIIAANTDRPSGVPLGECAAGNGPDVIHMRATPNVHTHSIVDSSFSGSNALPLVNTAIIIEGNGAVVERSSASGTPLFRLFAVALGGSLTLRDLTVRGGAEVSCGGGLLVLGTLALARTAVTGNSVVGSTGFTLAGGGICALGATLTLTDSHLTGNRARNASSAGSARGGGLYIAGGTTVLTNTTIAGNAASGTQFGFGGGIYALQGARLATIDSRVENNSATQTGTPTARYAGGGGIGAESSPGTSSTTVELTRTVVVGNTVVGGNLGGLIGAGGGLRLHSVTATILSSTIQGNSATAGGGVAAVGGRLSMTGGAIEANVATGVWNTAGGGGGILTDTGTSVSLVAVGVQNNRAPSGNGGGVFNRGALTIVGGELRGNSAQSGGALSNGTVLTTGGALTLTNVAIVANAATSYGGGIFNANPTGIPTTAVITVAGGRIQNNRAQTGGGIFTRPNSILALEGNASVGGNVAVSNGGGIYNEGTLRVTGSSISSNTAQLWAGVANAGTATLTGTTVSGNATNLFGGGGIGNGGLLTLVNSSVTENRTGAAGHGGGIEQLSGSLTLENSTVSGNTAGLGGGGLAMLFNASTAVIRNNSVIADNVASGTDGGGIFGSVGTTVTISDSTVHRNRSAASGGGIASRASVTMLRSRISDNRAGSAGGGMTVMGASASLTARQSQFSANQTTRNGLSWGGGLYLSGGARASLSDTHIEANASDYGAGLAQYQSGVVTFERGAISGNVATAGGGVLTAAGSRLEMRASTVSGNRAMLGGGALLFNVPSLPDALATFAYVTIAANDAPIGGGLLDTGGTPTALTASIVAGNTQGGNPSGFSADCFGSITGGGTNLVGRGTGCPIAGNRIVAPADVFATVLGPLSGNGGPSPTHELVPGSPAIDAGPATCRFPAVSLDQRGVARPRDGNGDGTAVCDIGAYER